MVHNTTPEQHSWVQMLEPRQRALICGDLSFFHQVLDMYIYYDRYFLDYAYFTLMGWPTTGLAQPKAVSYVMQKINSNLKHMFVVFPDMAWRAGETSKQPFQRYLCPCGGRNSSCYRCCARSSCSDCPRMAT